MVARPSTTIKTAADAVSRYARGADMKTTYLVAVSVLMLAVAAIGLLMMTVLFESLPPVIPDQLDSFGDRDRAYEIDNYRSLEDSGIARILAGERSISEIDRLAHAHDADRTSEALADGLGDAIRSAGIRAREHAGVMIAMFMALAIAGVFGILRLRMAGMAAFGGGLLAIATATGTALLIVTDGGAMAAIVAPPCLVALLALALAANLMPDPPIRAIARLERRLRGLTPIERSVYLATRIGIGAVSATAVLVATVATTHVRSPSAATIATLLFATGTTFAAVPLIAYVRLRVGGRELPIARVVAR
jgi:hypothetical protein